MTAEPKRNKFQNLFIEGIGTKGVLKKPVHRHQVYSCEVELEY